jgi:HTH-type transcriptional regulator, sugar sensing transcriptional regulator
MDTALLKEIGLTDGEIKVYLALFTLGSTSTGPLVKEAKIHSSKVYPILDRLIEKGLVSFIKEGKKTIYTANPPNTILSFLDKKQTRIKAQKEEAKDLIKELELQKTIEKAKTEATIFKGTKGVMTAYALASKDLKKGDVAYAMFLPPIKNKPLLNFLVNITNGLSKKGVVHYMLFNESCPEEITVKKMKNMNIRVGAPKEYQSPAEVCVYGNNTIISTTGGEEHITFLIQNKEIADSFKNQFSTFWNQEVYTLRGIDGLRTVFNDALNYKEVRFIGGNWGIVRYYKEFFKEWNKKREQKKVKWLDLVDTTILLKSGKIPKNIKYYNSRTLPPQVNSPAVLFLYGNKIVTIIWKKNSIFNVIENKDVAKHYKKYFDYLWGQDVLVSHGMKALTTAHEKTYDVLKKGEEYVCLGIPTYQPKEHHEFWQRDHKRRVKAGIKCRLLFNNDTSKAILKNRNSIPGGDSRYMPIDIKTPSYTFVYKDHITLAIPKKEPIVIEIKNKEVAESFKAYFEAFWKLSKKF